MSHETISSITNSVLEELEQWQNRPLKNKIAEYVAYVAVEGENCMKLLRPRR